MEGLWSSCCCVSLPHHLHSPGSSAQDYPRVHSGCPCAWCWFSTCNNMDSRERLRCALTASDSSLPARHRLVVLNVEKIQSRSCVLKLFSGLLRVSLNGSWKLARIKYYCKLSPYTLWTFRRVESKLRREVQSVWASNEDLENMYIVMCSVHGILRRASSKRKCNLSPTDLRAVPFLCDIIDSM